MHPTHASHPDNGSRDRTVFGVLFGVYYLLILYPILRADRYCNDDLIRALLGNYGWNNNGRPLATLVMRVLESNSQRIVDISPLPQIAAIALLAWIGVLIARRFAIRSPALAVMLALPLGAQPFFLENLAYKFDSVCMALALLLAVLSILANARGARAWWLGTLALLASLTLYQPALNAFLVFAILEAAVSHFERTPVRGIALRLGMRAVQVLVALLVYRWVFAASLQDWVKQHSATVDVFRDGALIVQNASAFLRFIADAFTTRALALHGPVLLIVLALPLAMSLRCALTDGRAGRAWRAIQRLGIGLLLLCMALLGVVGPMLLLADPVMMPRVLPGFGALLAAALIAAHVVLRQWPRSERWQLALGAVLGLGMAAYAAAFGNAAGAQQRYEVAIATQLAEDLDRLREEGSVQSYVIAGSAGLAPVSAHAARHFPLIHHLVLSYLREDDFNTRNFLRHHLARSEGAPIEALPAEQAAAVRAQACTVPAHSVRQSYRLQVIGNTALVTFRNGLAPRCEATESAPVAYVETLQ